MIIDKTALRGLTQEEVEGIEERGYIDPELPELPESRESDLMEEIMFNKEITLQYQMSSGGDLTLQLGKRYKHHTDVAKVVLTSFYDPTYGRWSDPEKILEWLQAALKKLNKKEV